FSIFTIRHPHTPLLFPYTTLFRSLSDAYYLSVPVSNEKDKAGPTAHREHILHFWLHTSGTASGRQGQRVYSTYDTYRVCSGSYRDRKSTRLNSSHVKISYAVFCLK